MKVSIDKIVEGMEFCNEDSIYYYNLEDKWFKFRDKRYKETAIEWCKYNKLEYIDDYKIEE